MNDSPVVKAAKDLPFFWRRCRRDIGLTRRDAVPALVDIMCDRLQGGCYRRAPR